MNRTEGKAHFVDIFLAGNADDARRVCRQHCMAVGLCVTVTETTFIYTGGEETGVRVGLVNYPRFPSTPEELFAKGEALAEKLITALCQWSALIQSNDRVLWLSRKPA